MSNYDYNKWLLSHSSSKSMMEKLERSLIPYELFALISMHNDRSERTGTIEHCGNIYAYTLTYSHECFGHEVYNAVIDAVKIDNAWQNPLMGYNRFKVVMKNEGILTIYSDHENYFQKIIDMFENEDISGLYNNRSSYVNNLLARYILLRLIETHYPGFQLLASLKGAEDEDGIIPVIAANANRTQLFMYAFSKSFAIEMARHYDGIARNLTVIYFINQDFERDGNNEDFNTDNSQVISIRQLYNSLPVEKKEKIRLEKHILILISLLYDESISWHQKSIRKMAMNPPRQQYVKSKNKSRKHSERRKVAIMPEKAWYHRIYRTLLEDALNVLHDTPVTHSDIFHFLCAANMVNAYVNICKRHGIYSGRYVNRMYRAKQQMADILITLVESGNTNVTISIDGASAVFAEITVNKCHYQFSFRGIDANHMMRLQLLNVPHGRYAEFSMQSIATVLYQYSFLNRWKSL